MIYSFHSTLVKFSVVLGRMYVLVCIIVSLDLINLTFTKTRVAFTFHYMDLFLYIKFYSFHCEIMHFIFYTSFKGLKILFNSFNFIHLIICIYSYASNCMHFILSLILCISSFASHLMHPIFSVQL